MIEIAGATLAYEGRPILSGVSFTIGAGEVVALAGANGAGKSTLLRAIAGLRPLAGGSIAVDGRPIGALDARERGRAIALIEAEGVVPDGVSVEDVVAAGRLPYRPWWRWSSSAADRAAVDGAIARLELDGVRTRIFAQLSSGERQRVWMAAAIAQHAPALLLDEPTSHLDIRHTFEALTLVRRLAGDGTSSIVVLHDLNVAAAFADRIALLGEGTLLAYDVPHAVFDETLLTRAYGIPITVRRDPGGAVVAFAVPPGR